MIEINENEIEIEIKETLSFKHHVQHIFDDVYAEVKDNLETYPEDYDEDELEARKEFLDHELTKEDKLEILEIIKDKYEYESCSLEYEVSIFDEDNIRDCICEWINGNFEFEV